MLAVSPETGRVWFLGLSLSGGTHLVVAIRYVVTITSGTHAVFKIAGIGPITILVTDTGMIGVDAPEEVLILREELLEN